MVLQIKKKNQTLSSGKWHNGWRSAHPTPNLKTNSQSPPNFSLFLHFPLYFRSRSSAHITPHSSFSVGVGHLPIMRNHPFLARELANRSDNEVSSNR
jgi:hypothetical protein